MTPETLNKKVVAVQMKPEATDIDYPYTSGKLQVAVSQVLFNAVLLVCRVPPFPPKKYVNPIKEEAIGMY